MESDSGVDSLIEQRIVSGFKDPIKLNVGGKIFMTSRATLLNQESMLSVMFSGRFTLEKGEDGSYFIDRDPTHFRCILNFLCDGEIEVPTNPLERNELLREAKYYSMMKLANYLCGDVETIKKQISRKYDPTRIGPHLTIDGANATSSYSYQPAFVESISKGIWKCTFSWKGKHILFGATGANINHQTRVTHMQPQSIMLHNSGRFFVAGVQEIESSKWYSKPRDVTVEIDSEKRTVTWIYEAWVYEISGVHSVIETASLKQQKVTKMMPDTMQAPFSFCVDLASGSSALIMSLQDETILS